MVKQVEKMNLKIVEEVSVKPHNMIAGLDINDIIKKAQGFYGKNEKGLASALSTGTSIIRPSEDKDFIIWEGNSFWQELTGLRGIPFGRFIQCAGLPDSGKSTFAGQFMAYAQKQGHFVILVDSEAKFQKKRYDEQIGGNSQNLLVVDTNSTIEAAKGVAYLVRTIKEQSKSAKILIVIDSIGALLNRNENNEEDENMSLQPGAQAKEINWLIKKIGRLMNEYQNRETAEHTIAVIAINQVYAKIGFMKSGYQEKGGSGLEYFSSIIISMQKKKTLTRQKNGKKLKYGIVSVARVKKNHLFDGSDCLAEADIVISADGIQLADDVKKKEKDVEGWNETDDNE